MAAWLIVFVRTHIPHVVVVENALSLLSPFIAYLPADALHVSGVLAVVTMGLYLGVKGPHVVAPATRLPAGAMWSMVTFLLESLIFMLVGLELPRVIVALRSHTLTQLAEIVLAATAVCILVRFVWVFISIYLGDGDRGRRGGASETSKGESMEETILHRVGGAAGCRFARDRACASAHDSRRRALPIA